MKPFVLVLAMLLVPSASFADQLFSFSTNLGGSQGGTTDYITMPIDANDGRPIFTTQRWTPANVGQTITITAADDPNFQAFSNVLTDGLPEHLGFGFYPAPATNHSGIIFPETQVVWGSPTDPRIDLHGYSVTQYSLTLDSLAIFNNVGGGDQSTFAASATFAAFGSPVPEPTVAGLAGLSTIMIRRRKRQAL